MCHIDILLCVMNQCDTLKLTQTKLCANVTHYIILGVLTHIARNVSQTRINYLPTRPLSEDHESVMKHMKDMRSESSK